MVLEMRAIYEIDVEEPGRLYLRTESGRIAMPYSERVCRGMQVYRSLVAGLRERTERSIEILEKRYERVDAMRPRGLLALVNLIWCREERMINLQHLIDCRLTKQEKLLELLRKEERECAAVSKGYD